MNIKLKESLDARPNNADWLRTMAWNLPTDPEEFLHTLQSADMTLEHFLTLPAAQAMPPELFVQLSQMHP